MATTYRVATLETAFTANTTEVDAAVKRVKGETDAITKDPATVDVSANVRDALRAFDEMEGVIRKVEEDVVTEVFVRADEAKREMQRLQDELDAFDKERPEAEILADIDKALRNTEEVQRELEKISGEKVKVEVDVDTERAASGFSRAKDATADLKDESRQNFAEMASSFDGSMDSIWDAGQSVLGGMATSTVPALGLALGGLGVVAGAFYAQWKESAEKTKAELSGMYDDLIASGEAYLSESYIQEQFWAIKTGAEDAVIAQDKLDKVVRETGLSAETVALAYAGSGEAMVEVQDKLNERLEHYRGLSNESASAAGVKWIQDEIDFAERRKEQIEETTEGYLRGRDALASYGIIGAEALRELESAEISNTEAILAANDAIAANGQETSNATEAGRANNQALIDQAESAVDYLGALRDAGAGTADLTAATGSQREAFIKNAEAAGYTRTKAEELADAYGLIPPTVRTDVVANTSDAETGIWSVNQQLDLLDGRRVNVTVQYNAAGEQVTRVGYNSLRFAAGGAIPGPPCQTTTLTIGATA